MGWTAWTGSRVGVGERHDPPEAAHGAAHSPTASHQDPLVEQRSTKKPLDSTRDPTATASHLRDKGTIAKQMASQSLFMKTGALGKTSLLRGPF